MRKLTLNTKNAIWKWRSCDFNSARRTSSALSSASFRSLESRLCTSGMRLRRAGSTKTFPLSFSTGNTAWNLMKRTRSTLPHSSEESGSRGPSGMRHSSSSFSPFRSLTGYSTSKLWEWIKEALSMSTISPAILFLSLCSSGSSSSCVPSSTTACTRMCSLRSCAEATASLPTCASPTRACWRRTPPRLLS